MPISQTIEPEQSSVAGLPIRRILPARNRLMVGPFIFMDQGGPITISGGPGGGVPEHPHAGLSTFTYLIEGSVQHRDSAGNEAVVRSGDVALMTSGSGITHEELPVPGAPSGPRSLFFAQMWLALPDHLEEMDPAFEHHAKATLPVLSRPGATVRMAMGSFDGVTAPTTCHVPALFAEIRLEAGATLAVPAAYDEQALMLLEGDAEVDAQALTSHQLNVLTRTETTVRSTRGAHLLLIGGARFPTRRYIGGSFVASSPQKLRRWMQDAAYGRWPRIAR
ncbi:MAG: pirin family protein [Deltaproteobacteria bacterium]|nr:pirin family protein [Deltaproteobacteria bacterium]